MNDKDRNIVIAGASSDIGMAIAKHWSKTSNIIGTYRSISNELEDEKDNFSALIHCDFSDKLSIDRCISDIDKKNIKWDVLVMCSSTMEPIGAFASCDIDEWENALQVNLIGQLRFVHKMLKIRSSVKKSPIVLFFAGGGTNSAPLNFSSYNLSKVALIKAVELLDAEISDTCFSIIGPGWVKTKIHEQTLKAGDTNSNGAASITKNRLENNDFVPMQKVIDCCDWIVSQPKELVGGRNFSVANDFDDIKLLCKSLEENQDMFKLRRFGNNILKK